MTVSRLVPGVVGHVRRRPRPHRLRYRLFQLLLDLDELPELDARLKLFSVDRFNLVSFHAEDHLDPAGPPLRRQVQALLADAGVRIDNGSIRLLAMPRVLGLVFNPLSLFFCHHPDGALAAILYEVNNTFGERHVYVLPVDPAQAHGGRVRQSCEKRFFVSPFMPMDLRYAFDVLSDARRIGVDVAVSDGDGELLKAQFHGRSMRLTDRSLLRAWTAAPLLSLKVLGAIHWQALWIWRKGLRLQARQPTAAMGVSLGACPAARGPQRERACVSEAPVLQHRAVG